MRRKGACIVLWTVLLKVLADECRHLEHRDLLFAKNGLELCICQDLTLVLRVLQIVGLDVIPHFFDDFGAR